MDEFNPQFSENMGNEGSNNSAGGNSSNQNNDLDVSPENEIIETCDGSNSDAKGEQSADNVNFAGSGGASTNGPTYNTESTGNGYRSADSSETLRSAPFYTENYRKQPNRKNNSIWQLILVSVISAIIGAFSFAAVFLIVAPAASPAIKSYIQDVAGISAESPDVKELADVNKRVEIVGESNIVAEIAEAVGPTVVGVKVTFRSDGGWLFGSREEEGIGSGVIIRKDGYIMTNYHVIQNALDFTTNKISKGSKIEIILPNKKDKPYTAEYVGGDSKTDLAVLKINEKNLPVAKLGDSDKIRVGELAVAIGNPGGLELAGSVTSGVISGINRTLSFDDGTQLPLIQTDAAISPGNSGGALVNSKGEVIGVNRLKIVDPEVEGLGFAIPINKAKDITKSLIESGYVKGRPWLGITSTAQYTEEIAKSYNMPYGVYVYEVQVMSGAFKAGIKPNDIITRFDGKRVYTVDDINRLKEDKKPGDTVEVEIYRDGEYKTLKVTLTEAKQ